MRQSVVCEIILSTKLSGFFCITTLSAEINEQNSKSQMGQSVFPELESSVWSVLASFISGNW
ncbi:MAG: hypothetical protein PHS59_14120 [Paludibacter sp.]|nr:hypothetical protein [Paludibacter sp.]